MVQVLSNSNANVYVVYAEIICYTVIHYRYMLNQESLL